MPGNGGTAQFEHLWYRFKDPCVERGSGIDASCRLIETDDEPCSGTKDRDREASPTNHRLAGDVDPLCIGDL